jgi:aryl-alcohol dehydrogenase-like predicted oxidoreductase
LSAIESSLENLQTDFVDIYYAHVWDAGTPLEETLRTFNDLIRAGKVRYIGVSNFSGWQLEKALCLSKFMGLERFIVYQGQYSLLCREAEFEILPCCCAENLGFLPWSPLKGGWLSGRYKRGMSPNEGSRVEWSQSAGWSETDFQSHNNEKTWRILDEVEKISLETKKSMAAVSLRWAMQRPHVTSTVIGPKSAQQLEDNLDVMSFSLNEQQMERLNSVSKPQSIYPYHLLNPDGRGSNERT